MRFAPSTTTTSLVPFGSSPPPPFSVTSSVIPIRAFLVESSIGDGVFTHWPSDSSSDAEIVDRPPAAHNLRGLHLQNTMVGFYRANSPIPLLTPYHLCWWIW